MQAPVTNLGRAVASLHRGEGASDEQLARAAGRGDAAAFEALYQRFEPQLLSFARHMLGQADDAEDVVQHTFLAADRTFRGGKVPKAVRAWLYTVARNRCVSIIRARREDQALPDAGMPSTENLAAAVEQREDLRNLLADLRRLPEQQRAALLLAELGDLSHAEVAGVIGVRPGKIKALVFQARETLMAAADARSIPCRSIQEELATAAGAATRRRHLRHHLDQCAGCREYAERVRAQRASLALILPVVPSLALREGVLSAVGGSAAGAAAGAGAGAGLGVLAAKTTAAKLLAIAAVGGAAAGGGTVALTADDASDRARSAESAAERRRSAPAATVVPPSTGAPVAADERPVPVRARERRTGGARDAAGRSRGHRKAKPLAAEAPGRAEQKRKHHGTAPGQAKKEQRGAAPGQATKEQRGAPPGQAKPRNAPAAPPQAATTPRAAEKSAAPKPAARKPPKPAAAAPPAASAAPQPPRQPAKEAKTKANAAAAHAGT